MSGNPIPGDEEKFLLAEYEALINIDTSRNERLDRFLTIFVTLSAAPWALYALVLRDNHNADAFGSVPFPIAAVFVLVGILGFVVAMMFVQMRFTIILYTRAMNKIRGYFSGRGDIQRGLRLPIRDTVPPYYEKGSYIQIALGGMALVSSGYIAFGAYGLTSHIGCYGVRIGGSVLLFVFCWFGHMIYYRGQADTREEKDREGGLKWKK